MRVAIVGARGQLGTALQACLKHEVIALGREVIDVTRAESVDAALQAARPQLVINAAAYNFVDRAENEPEAAFAVNALGPRNLARSCERIKAPLVHVSSDYVFGANRKRCTPYTEDDIPGPLSVYAASKLSGEHFVRAASDQNLVVRTCGLYGRATSEGKGNFIKTMLRLAQEKPEVKVVNDQRCTPSAASDVAAAIAELIEARAMGLFHVTNSGDCSWHELTAEIFRVAGLKVNLRAIPTSEYPTPATRPTYSVLDIGRLTTTIGRPMPSWQDAVARYVASI